MNTTVATHFARFGAKAGIIGGGFAWAGVTSTSPSWSVGFGILAVLATGYILFDEVHRMATDA